MEKKTNYEEFFLKVPMSRLQPKQTKDQDFLEISNRYKCSKSYSSKFPIHFLAEENILINFPRSIKG